MEGVDIYINEKENRLMVVIEGDRESIKNHIESGSLPDFLYDRLDELE